MRILITGGNGFLGRHLVPALLERGDAVRVLALPSEDASWLEARGVEVYRGDVRSAESLVWPLRGVEKVVHLAAMQDVWRPLADYRAVNVAGTANLCRAALVADVERVVHISSASIYGFGRPTALSEDAALAPFPDPYAITKAAADRLVQRLVWERGLPAVILRPAQIFGPGDRVHFGQMADRLRAGRGVIVGSGRNLMPFIYASDAVQGILLALDGDRAVGEAFNVASDHPLSQVEMLNAIAEAIGAPRPRIHLPFRALYAVGWAAETAARLDRSRHRPLLTRFGVAFFGSDTRYSIRSAWERLGFRPRVPLREGVRLAASWYRGRALTPDEAGALRPQLAGRSAEEGRVHQ
jgi:dihydroflavonol-4-reductase